MFEERYDKPRRDRKGTVFAPQTGPLRNLDTSLRAPPVVASRRSREAGCDESRASGRGSDRGHVYLAIGLVLMAAKISLGIVSGSKALVVSAMLSMQGCVWAGIVIVRSKTSGKPASQEHPFGLGKVEFLVAGWMSLLVLVGVAVLCGTIAHSLLEHHQRAPGILAMWVALVSAAVCLAVSRQVGRASPAVSQRKAGTARPTHSDLYLADAYASMIVAGSVILARMGFELIDSVVAIGEVLFVVWCAARLLYGSVRGLLDASVTPEKIAEIEAAVRETDGVFDVCSVKAVQSGQEVLATIVVDLPDAMTIAEADEVRWRIGALLRRRLDDVGQVLVGFRTRDEHRHAHRIKTRRVRSADQECGESSVLHGGPHSGPYTLRCTDTRAPQDTGVTFGNEEP